MPDPSPQPPDPGPNRSPTFPHSSSTSTFHLPQHVRWALQDIGAGTVGGIGAVLVGHPLDTIKVRLQTSRTGGEMSMLSCARMTMREEGIRGFWKGMQSPLAGEGFFNAVQFLTYGASKRFLLEQKRQRLDHENDTAKRLSPVSIPSTRLVPASSSAMGMPRPLTRDGVDLPVGDYFLIGAFTGFCCTFVESPIDLWKTQSVDKVSSSHAMMH